MIKALTMDNNEQLKVDNGKLRMKQTDEKHKSELEEAIEKLDKKRNENT